MNLSYLENPTYQLAPSRSTLSAIDQTLAEVITEAHTRRFSVSGDFARRNAAQVAMASSLGLITTKINSNVFGRDWLPTAFGLTMLAQMEANSPESACE